MKKQMSGSLGGFVNRFYSRHAELVSGSRCFESGEIPNQVRNNGIFSVRKHLCAGFTLIELLVVVLIIGILATVAVPQYQKVVEKSRAAQVLPLLKAVAQAHYEYYVANGTYASSFDELSVDIEWTGRQQGYHYYRDVRSNKDWSLQLPTIGAPHSGLTGDSVMITRISGPYRGGGFDFNVQTQKLLCMERPIFKATKGSYCEKIFQATNTGYSADTRSYYMP